MGSGAMIYIPSFIKIGSGIQTLIGGIHRQHSDHISLLSESTLKMKKCVGEAAGEETELLGVESFCSSHKTHHCVHTGPLLDPILSQLNPVHTVTHSYSRYTPQRPDPLWGPTTIGYRGLFPRG
jgi:hypothetical protein